MKTKFRKLVAILGLAMLSVVAYASNSNSYKVGGRNITASDTVANSTMVENLFAALLGFVPVLQGLLIVFGIVMFGIMPLMQMRGQQLDPTELIKNGALLLLFIGAGFFGPKLIEGFDSSGANIEITQIVENKNTNSNIVNLIQ